MNFVFFEICTIQLQFDFQSSASARVQDSLQKERRGDDDMDQKVNCENHKDHKNHKNYENHENHKNHQEGERDTEWTNIIPTMEKRKSRLRYESADSR